jgi:hypothetical protein
VWYHCLSRPQHAVSCQCQVLRNMSNKINARGHISGRAIVLIGPDASNIHAFLATPVNGSMGILGCRCRTYTSELSLPANVAKQPPHRLILGRFGQ